MYANDFAPHDGVLRVHMIAHGDKPPKSDAFLLEYNGAYILIDAGVPDNDASLQYLLALRRRLLCGHPAQQDDPACRLRLTCMASHCHVDHIGGLYTYIFPSPFLEVDAFYLPPASAMDDFFSGFDSNGDVKYRPLLEQAQRTYQPQARVITHDFGAENRFSFRMIAGDETAPLVTVCPAYLDYGVGEKMEHLIDLYCEGERTDRRIAILAVNNCSDWFHIRHGARSFLFTGDTTKKADPAAVEMAGEMTDTYLPILGAVDVVKYVHHGYARDAAAADMMRFDPKYVVVTTVIATGHHVIRSLYPDSPVCLLNCAEQTYVFSTDGDALQLTPTPATR